MIEAGKHPLLERWMDGMNVRMLRRHFNSVRVSGLENLAGLDRSRPIVVTPNHSCWWDGLLAFFLSRHVLHLDSYLMMEERQLARYRFFRRIGAFSVIREQPRSAVRSLRYAATLFDRPGRAVWIYPQGTMQPVSARPLLLFQGVGWLAGLLGDVQVVPVAHRYEFLLEQRPEALTLFGSPLRFRQPVSHQEVTATLGHRLTELLDALQCSVSRAQCEDFTTVLRGRTSTNRAYDFVRGIRP